MKTLVESLFDDNIKKDIHLGDLLELEKWDTPEAWDDDIISKMLRANYDMKKAKSLINKPKWKKFLEPYRDEYKKPPTNYINAKYNWETICWYLTWVALSCGSGKEAETKLVEYLKDISYEDELADEFTINEVEVISLNRSFMNGLPRMIVFKFHTRYDNIKEGVKILYMTLKKKD
jgi:hypothetical protein